MATTVLGKRTRSAVEAEGETLELKLQIKYH